MRKLPDGTLTLLHTDVQDSTLLTVQLGERYPGALAAHRALLRAAFAAYEGYEVDTQGDAFFVVFPRATQAVAAAVRAQRDLAAERWPQNVALRVRIGIHTGEPTLTTEGYTGLDVIQGARIKDAGHGGQVLLSKSAAVLAEPVFTDGLSLRDLGEYRLKGLPQPERIFQLVIPDLPADFPALWSLGALARGKSPGRVLTTVLSCDMVGSASRIAELGDRRWLDLLRLYLALVKGELTRHGGEAIDVVGDEILAGFDVPGAAIRCGLAIRTAVRRLDIVVKVGIHAGEIEPTGTSGISGIVALTCVRIRQAAQPGEVLVSNTVKELVTGSDIAFTDRCTHALRGLPREWRLFAPA